MSQITSPIILDSTGQDIVDAIASLSNRANDIENFTSSDVADGSATAWTSVTPLASGEVHSSIFAKISQMFKNIRYLYKILGTTNISSIGGGTVTGAISTLNSKTVIYSGYKSNVTNVSVGTNLTFPSGKTYLTFIRNYSSATNVQNNVYIITLLDNGTWAISVISEEYPSQRPTDISHSGGTLTFTLGKPLYGAISMLSIMTSA